MTVFRSKMARIWGEWSILFAKYQVLSLVAEKMHSNFFDQFGLTRRGLDVASKTAGIAIAFSPVRIPCTRKRLKKYSRSPFDRVPSDSSKAAASQCGPGQISALGVSYKHIVLDPYSPIGKPSFHSFPVDQFT